MKLRRTLSALVAAGLLALAACGSSTTNGAGGSSGAATGSESSAPKIYGGTPMSEPLPAALLDMPLTDSTGKTVHLSDFRGKTVVISDSMTLCQESCPIDTATMLAAARSYLASAPDPSNVVFLTITVDPQRDTPAQLAAYRQQYVGAASQLPQWQLLTGSPTDIAALWKHFGVWVKKVKQDDVVHNWRTGALLTYDIDHSDELFFLDGTGNERYILDGMPSLGSGKVPAKIQRFLSEDGRKNEMKDKGWTAPQAVSVLHWLAG